MVLLTVKLKVVVIMFGCLRAGFSRVSNFLGSRALVRRKRRTLFAVTVVFRPTRVYCLFRVATIPVLRVRVTVRALLRSLLLVITTLSGGVLACLVLTRSCRRAVGRAVVLPRAGTTIDRGTAVTSNSDWDT